MLKYYFDQIHSTGQELVN